jgi:pilus assembly protein Flp/PilA
MQSRIRRRITTAIRCAQEGQGLVEYALLLVLIAIACITILSALGNNISILYSASNVMVGLP